MVLKKILTEEVGRKKQVKIIVHHCFRINSPGFPQMFLIGHFSFYLVSYTQTSFPHVEAQSEEAKSVDIVIIFAWRAEILFYIMHIHSPNLTQTLLFRRNIRLYLV